MLTLRLHRLASSEARLARKLLGSPTCFAGLLSDDTVSGGRTCPSGPVPKVAYVFDEEVDIWDDNQVKWAQAFRFDPIRDTVIIPCMNTMTIDPMIAKDDPRATISKIGFDCTIPWGEKWVQSDFQRSAPFELGDPPAGVASCTFGRAFMRSMKASTFGKGERSNSTRGAQRVTV